MLAVNANLLARLNHLAYVFPVPFVIGRCLEHLVFTFIWGGRNKQVAHVIMYMDREKGGRGVICAPLKTMALFVSFVVRLTRGLEESEGHILALFA